VTLSISGRCERTGMLGIAITSSSMSVAARCAHARADIGVCATQNITDPRIGPLGLSLLEQGLDVEAAIRSIRARPDAEFRQVGLIDSRGNTAFYSGSGCLGTYGAARGKGALALGNLLANQTIPDRMVRTFESNPAAHLGDRLLAALQAGVAAGGEAGPLYSAGMVLVERVAWPVADLRVDHAEDPVTVLGQLWSRWRPDMDAYVTRALDPSGAPRFGVPGDEDP
jgi:uncharacterized Ntn-hydrolase superfamily protein